jgi:hypothetical protein
MAPAEYEKAIEKLVPIATKLMAQDCPPIR